MFRFAAPVTMANASVALAEAGRALADGEQEFSLAGLEGSDSSVIAVLLDLQRRGRALQRVPRLIDVPATVASFVALYGVDALFPELRLPEARQESA